VFFVPGLKYHLQRLRTLKEKALNGGIDPSAATVRHP
jgi:hypothetical protein